MNIFFRTSEIMVCHCSVHGRGECKRTMEKQHHSYIQMFINDYKKPPLEALMYLTGECNYGGRVTDERDRRLIISLLSIFYCADVISNDDYKLSSSGQYYVPSEGDHDTYTAYIRSLPLLPHPEVGIPSQHKSPRYRQTPSSSGTFHLLFLSENVVYTPCSS